MRYAGRSILGILAGLILSSDRPLNARQDTPAGVEFFEKKVRPILTQRCYSCHSAQARKLKARLYLDTREGVRKGGTSGRSIIPGKPGGSLLIRAVRYTDENLQMPPKGKLSAAEIKTLEEWVDMGAPDPRKGGPAAGAVGSKPFWSFVRPKAHPAPKVKNASWPRTDIDRFILTRLEAKGLTPVGDADRYTLIRRVYFDLVGLPPSPEEIDAFVKDKASDACEKVVKRLLASPRFGERWGRHWLDVARFAESSGLEFNFTYPHAWPYRDYVIDSFNADKRYDRFVREQIAGDLLEGKGDDRIVATAFLAFGPKRHNAGSTEFRADMVDDQIDAISKSILGLTVSCARCHDHKFDPIPSKDYYALAGIFYSTETLFGTIKQKYSRWPTDVIPVGPDAKKREAAFKAHGRKVSDLTKKLGAKKAALKKAGKDAKKAAPLKKEVAKLEAGLKALKKNAPRKPHYSIAVREGRKPADVKINVRGDPRQKGAVARRGFLGAISVDGALKIDPKKSGRRALAEWLAHEQNPLTARVMVNRIWAHLFGRGIVETLNNFGALGKRPTHPELLDTLAVEFMRDGWSVKKAIRKIVLSRAYQLGGGSRSENLAADPDNRLNWRMEPRRLEAEALRDAILAVSGKLDLKRPEGSTVTGLGDTLVRGIALEKLQPPSTKRSVYLPVIRDYLPEIFQLFDFPDPSLVSGKRASTTVPTQALYFRNSAFVREQTAHAARRLLGMKGLDDAGRVDRAYLAVLARRPSAGERRDALDYIAFASKAEKKDGRTKAWAGLVQALFSTAEFRYLVDVN